MVGQILPRRNPLDRRPTAAGKIDLGYLFLLRGRGFATEACAAVLRWLDGVLPGEPVVLATQSANLASMRLAARLSFTEPARLPAWDADQWFGQRSPADPSHPGGAAR